ncbi:hypothetical protein OC846_004378 [Tilletia horrida]|uniref:Uncharacterized protein n=1 Tax=Tilletia horrida TaxID=155126 RepID=A0AAN6JR60_9BASI|nr:hypothetical protein OC845_003921 [Tilletia horrida]KAK0548690.1 hypothetical protein OC846_004378 [Tilletia horrida]KAK0566929.1 hypothetical protein OC861_002972 [Tilletia horrida]
MPPSSSKRRRGESSGTGRSKRQKVKDGGDSFPRSDRLANAGKGLQDLPVEIVHKILILSGNPALPTINRYFLTVCQHAPVNVRAAYIISRYWTEIRAEEPVDENPSGKILRVRFGNAALPPLLFDARELVATHTSLAPINQAFWDRLIRGAGLEDHLQNPLGYALHYGICSSPVIDAFSAMLYRIPTFTELARRVTREGRMRISEIPSGLIDRLRPLRANIIDIDDGSQSSSPLIATVKELDEHAKDIAPRPLETFLRVLFWHFDSNTMMPIQARPAPAPLMYHSIPTRAGGGGGTTDSDDSVGPYLTATLLKSVRHRNLWALRLLLRFERKRTGPPSTEGVNNFNADQTSTPAADASTSNFFPLFVAVHRGWLEGLRVMLEFESPDEVLLESRVCNDIARYLLDHVIDPNEPFLADERKKRAASSSSSSSGTGAGASTGNTTPPPAVMFARAVRGSAQPRWLTIAVQAGHFDIAEYLMKHHGVSPDMNTISALERLRRRRRREAIVAAAQLSS